jgi:hypothetical protein
MSYDEFWNKDYKLVESYRVKHDQDVQQAQADIWESAQYLRMALREIATQIFSQKGKKPFEFPAEPEPRTARGRYLRDRQKKIDGEFKRHVELRRQERLEKKERGK